MSNINVQVNKAHSTAWKILGMIIVIGVVLKTVNHIDIVLLAIVVLALTFRKQIAKLIDHKINTRLKSAKETKVTLTEEHSEKII